MGRRAGVGRILYTSQMGAAHDSRFQACRDHARTEDLLRATGLPWTALRNGFSAASALQFLEPARHTGDIALPADGPVAWTGHDDLAEAAAAILAEEGRFEGPTPPLTGAAALDFGTVAEIASRATGRPFTRTVVPDAAFHEQALAHGAPAASADLTLSIIAAARNGEFTADHVKDPYYRDDTAQFEADRQHLRQLHRPAGDRRLGLHPVELLLLPPRRGAKSTAPPRHGSCRDIRMITRPPPAR
ncbi:Rossmann-fold NAD(P)-binding domain-containing protein [Nonomuraea wenchangensis]|uniref:NAD(P)H dehydrogenase (Quinone) n=1 Tax=Nonomuraea wenchangensis TaxID=568860 RepID=A0A1I0LWF3_9ACTN|nr:hypothetical protein [Nonomuraea wenchangensis]SEU47527.1 hypothetical protein SAMN05421811_12942 [Nonomuraea wenchangensis]